MMGAFACLMVLFAIAGAVVSVVDVIRKRRLDRDYDAAMREADRLGLLEKYK